TQLNCPLFADAISNFAAIPGPSFVVTGVAHVSGAARRKRDRPFTGRPGAVRRLSFAGFGNVVATVVGRVDPHPGPPAARGIAEHLAGAAPVGGGHLGVAVPAEAEPADDRRRHHGDGDEADDHARAATTTAVP